MMMDNSNQQLDQQQQQVQSQQLPQPPLTPIALDANPVCHQYECLQPRLSHASAGPGLIWRIYAAKRRSSSGQSFHHSTGLTPPGTTVGGICESAGSSSGGGGVGGGLGDAISAAYTSLRQRNSFSGLSAALSGSASPEPQAATTVATGGSLGGAGGAASPIISGNVGGSIYQSGANQGSPSGFGGGGGPFDHLANVTHLNLSQNLFYANLVQLSAIYGRCQFGQVSSQQRLSTQLLQQQINIMLLGQKMPDRVSIFFYDKKAPQIFENNLQQQQQQFNSNNNNQNNLVGSPADLSCNLDQQQQTPIKYKKKDLATAQDLLRSGVKHLERCRQMKMLLLLQTIEESSQTIAFVTEAILGSLQNLIDLNNNLELPLVYMGNNTNNTNSISQQQSNINGDNDLQQQEMGFYQLTQFEIKYGLLQITEALLYLHYSSKIIHRNINSKSILINDRGTWKLAGLEFALKSSAEQGLDPMVPRPCTPYNNKMSSFVQPELDYHAPEIFLTGSCSPQSDMFSLGVLIAQLFNYCPINGGASALDDRSSSLNSCHYQNGNGPHQWCSNRPLIDCQRNSNNYLKQIEQLNVTIPKLVTRLPQQLEEPIRSLLDVDPKKRHTSESFSMIKYFTNDGIHALQYLDMIQAKDSAYKSNFYYNLTGVLDQIPKKMWFQHILASILSEVQRNELMATTIEPILYMIDHSSDDEFELILAPFIKLLFYVPKSVQATVSLLENFHIIINRIGQPHQQQQQQQQQRQHQQRLQMAQLMLNSLDSNAIQIQSAALDALIHIVDFIDHDMIKMRVIQKIRQVFEANINDLNIQLKALKCIESLLTKLDKIDILDSVLPLLTNTKLNDTQILMFVIRIYRRVLSDNEQKLALTCNLLALRVIPILTPALVCPTLSVEEFSLLIELLQDMLECINQNQRQKIQSGKMSLCNEDIRYGNNWTAPWLLESGHANGGQLHLHHQLHSVQQQTGGSGSLGQPLSTIPVATSSNISNINIKDNLIQSSSPSPIKMRITTSLPVPQLPTTTITSASPMNSSLNDDSNEDDNYDDLMGSINGFNSSAASSMINQAKPRFNSIGQPQYGSSLAGISNSPNRQPPSNVSSAQVSPVHAFRMKEKEQQQQRPPTLNLDKRRTSISMDDVIRRMSMNASSSCLLGGGGSSSDHKTTSNNFGFLKVNNQVPARRHSDNTILPPKILIAPSSPDGHSSAASRLSSKLKLNLSNQKLSSPSSNKNSKCNLATAAFNYTRRHSSANDDQPSISPSLFLNSSAFKTKSSSNLGFDFLLTNRSMKRRYSTASMFGHQTQRKAENIIESIGSAGMKGMQQIFGK